MKKTNIKTETYKAGNWRIDIVETHDKWNTIEAWLYYKNYGIKDLMFGASLNNDSKEHFLELVEVNLEDYVDDYINEHMADSDLRGEIRDRVKGESK